MACWNPSTLYTNRGPEEWPVGIPLPYIPIEDSKRSLVGIPLPYIPIDDYKNGVLESLYLRYQ